LPFYQLLPNLPNKKLRKDDPANTSPVPTPTTPMSDTASNTTNTSPSSTARTDGSETLPSKPYTEDPDEREDRYDKEDRDDDDDDDEDDEDDGIFLMWHNADKLAPFDKKATTKNKKTKKKTSTKYFLGKKCSQTVPSTHSTHSTHIFHIFQFKKKKKKKKEKRKKPNKNTLFFGILTLKTWLTRTRIEKKTQMVDRGKRHHKLKGSEEMLATQVRLGFQKTRWC